MRQSLISIFFLFVVGSTYGQKPRLEGHWRRNALYRGSMTYEIKPQFGDFIFKQDSTFTIVGDTSTSNSNISGWHVGDEKKGKWSLSGKSIFLYFEDISIPLYYKVLKLTNKKLVLTNSKLRTGKLRFNRLLTFG